MALSQISPTTNTTTTTTPTPQTFPQFSRLPPELRFHIYTLSILSQPRIIYLIPSPPPEVNQRAYTPAYPPIPALLLVSAESRAVARRYYTLHHAPHENLYPRWYYFNSGEKGGENGGGDCLGIPFAVPHGLVDFLMPMDVLVFRTWMWKEGMGGGSEETELETEAEASGKGKWRGRESWRGQRQPSKSIRSLFFLPSQGFSASSFNFSPTELGALFTSTFPSLRTAVFIIGTRNSDFEAGFSEVEEVGGVPVTVHEEGLVSMTSEAAELVREIQTARENLEVLEGWYSRSLSCRIVRPVFTRDQSRWWAQDESWKRFPARKRMRERKKIAEPVSGKRRGCTIM